MKDTSKIDITPDNINEYYDKVNKLIDEYFEWDVRPHALKKYFKPGGLGFKKFIDRNNLSNVKNIEKVIKDVVDDRYAMEKDNVLTFESFGKELLESTLTASSEGTGLDYILYNNIKESGLKEEKIIADYYRTSLGHVEEVDAKLHEYTVSVLKADYNIILFSDSELERIKENLVNYLENYLSNKKISVHALKLTLDLKYIVSSDYIKEQVSSKSYIINVISEILSTHEYTYQREFGNYHFWQR